MKQVFYRGLLLVGVVCTISVGIFSVTTKNTVAQSTQPCVVDSAYFTPNTVDQKHLGRIDPPERQVRIKTRGCSGKDIKIWLVSQITGKPVVATPPTGQKITMTDSGIALIKFTVGEDQCVDHDEDDLNTELLKLPLNQRLQIANALKQTLVDQNYFGTLNINNNGTVSADTKTGTPEQTSFGIALAENNIKWVLLERFNIADCNISIRTLSPDATGIGTTFELADFTKGTEHIQTNPQSHILYQCWNDYGVTALNNITNPCNSEWSTDKEVFTPEKIALAGDCVYKTGDKAGELIPDCYELLAPIPGLGSSVFFHGGDGSGENFAIGKYITVITQILIGAASVAAVVFLVYIGAMMVATGENPAKKLAMKGKLLNVVIGLAIVLGVYVILDTINPELLNINPRFDKVTLTANPDGDNLNPADNTGGFQTGNSTGFSLAATPQIYCPGNGGSSVVAQVANSFKDKTVYRLGGKGAPLPPGTSYPGKKYICDGKDCRTFCPTNKLCLDCSGFVNHVLRCSGLGYANLNTVDIFKQSKTETIVSSQVTGNDVFINNKKLIPGDMVGAPSDHVILYIGNNTFMDSHGGASGWQTDSIGTYTWEKIKSKYDYKNIRRIASYP